MRHLHHRFSTRRLRAGGYTAVATAIVIAIAVAVNLFVSALPESVIRRDFTQDGLYTLSEQTKRIVSAVEKEVTLYLVSIAGSEDAGIQTLLERYVDLSPNVKTELADPVQNPGFLKTFGTNMSINSVIVSCGEKYRIVDYNDIYVSQYQYDAYYGYTMSTSFNGEQALTSAIYYVTSDTLPKVYTLSGHGETALSQTVTDGLSQQNMESASLSLLTEETVPEDASAVVIAAPQSDISQEEAQKLIDYLNGGGNVVLYTDMMDEETMPNLLSVAQAMGMTVGEGMIVEGDASRTVRGYNYYLLPILSSHTITDPLIDGGYYVMLPMAQPLETLDDGVTTVTPILTTSEDAYSKLAGYEMTTTEREDGDLDGPFNVGLVAERDGAKMVWFSSPLLLDENVNLMIAGANYDLFLNALGWMCEQEESVSIRAKSLDVQALTVPQSQASLWSAIMIGVIPLALAAAGIVIYVRRKRR